MAELRERVCRGAGRKRRRGCPTGSIPTPTSSHASRSEFFPARRWLYTCLEAEIPNPGDFKRSRLGAREVVAVRNKDGAINVLVNRCAHRSMQFCMQNRGTVKEFVCPYHQWTYDLDGKLLGLPFRRGYKGKGGMPADFDPAEHGLETLAVACRNGVVFASFAQPNETLETYLGPKMLGYFDRVFDGRKLEVLGYMRQRIPSNWKLMMENIKDPYHASLLHVFLISFGLFRADQESSMEMDETGRHAVLVSRRGESERYGGDRADALVPRALHIAGPASDRPGARIPRRRHRGHADDMAEPDRAAAIERAGGAPDRAARPA